MIAPIRLERVAGGKPVPTLPQSALARDGNGLIARTSFRGAKLNHRGPMKLILLTAALALTVTTAHAQPGRGGKPPNPDADNDGKVTLSEFKAVESSRQERMFARLDTNKDGKITQAEFDTVAKQGEHMGRGARMGGIMRLDADKDGAVTVAEAGAMAQRRFEMADANKDGWLSKEETAMIRQRARGGPGPG